MGNFYIGTSNVVIPGNKSTFPDAYRDKSRLHYYSSLFNSVEINSSFYKIPQTSTYQKWSLDVTSDFRFSLKLSKTVTHAKALVYNENDITHFLTAAKGINKKGCLLIQFPGKISIDYFSQVERILNLIRNIDVDRAWKMAVEFRHPGWYIQETVELLDETNSGIVLQDFPKARNMEFKGSASFAYIRFHGPQGDYRGGYTTDFLKGKAREIGDWLSEGKDVYAYFNNTIGAAFENALTLANLVRI